jgi:hypothetical protein
MNRPRCFGRIIDGELYNCGRSVGSRDPSTDGCLHALFICTDCSEEVMRFVDRAQDAKAVRQEWEVD